ncbi:retention module-containing protein, partial [Aquipseudomonas guryensis]
MSNVVAVVKGVVGQVIALSPEGIQRLLVEGDRLFRGDQVMTGQQGTLSLQLQGGQDLEIGQNSQWLASTETETQPTQATQAPSDDELAAEELQQAIAAGVDPTAELPATAAGPGAGGAGGGAGGAGGGHSFVLLSETAQQLNPTVGFATEGLDNAFAAIEDETPAPTPAAATTTDATQPAAENTPPPGGSFNFETAEDTPFEGSFQLVDADGDSLTFNLLDAPDNGQLTLNPDGSWLYTPNPDYNGPDSFQVQVSDGRGGVNTLVVNIGVTPVNDAPVAVADAASVAEGGSVLIDLAGNDTDSDDGIDPSSIVITGNPANGTVTVNADGTVSYQHNGSETTGDSFTYTIKDASGQVSNPVTVTVGVTPSNDAPVAVADSASVAEGGSVLIDLAGNDTDSDDGIDPSSIVITGNPANGTVTVNADGTVSYQHNGSETTGDSFTYTIKDASGQVSNPVTVTVGVTPSNDAPVAVADAASVAEGGSVLIDLAGNDTDSDDGLDLGSIVITGNPANGTITVNADGTVSYQHNGSETTGDSFTYTIKDASGQTSNPVTVTVGVTPSNDAPVAVADAATVAEGGSVLIDLAGNDTDSDDGIDPSSIVITGNPANGTVTVNADGTVSYQHNGSETTGDSFTYTIKDASGQVSNPVTVTVGVTPS